VNVFQPKRYKRQPYICPRHEVSEKLERTILDEEFAPQNMHRSFVQRFGVQVRYFGDT